MLHSNVRALGHACILTSKNYRNYGEKQNNKNHRTSSLQLFHFYPQKIRLEMNLAEKARVDRLKFTVQKAIEILKE